MLLRLASATTLGVFALCVCAAQGCDDGADTGSGGFAATGESTSRGGAGPHGSGAGQGANGQGGSGGVVLIGSASSGTACKNLECQQVKCDGGAKTTVSGTIYEPAGKTPLYNVAVYVPNADLDALTDGASCDKCSTALSGDPIASTVTDTSGHFSLEDVPVGDDIPLVIQVGKWRRQISIPKVKQCVDTPMTDVTQTRLPRNQAEGHIPKIALSTGGADPLECLLPKIGLDLAEFTPESGTGRINLFHGSGGTSRYDDSLNGGVDFSDSETGLWADQPSLMRYDIVLLACESGQHMETKPDTALQAMLDYADAGGRIFASHWHNAWIEHGPAPINTVAHIVSLPDLPNPITGTIDQSFPKGAALAEWLVAVQGSTTLGDVDIKEAQHTVDMITAPPSQQWIHYDASSDGPSIQYFTFNTPIGAPDDQVCGRFVFSDIHVSSGDQVGSPFPTGCQTTDLSPQEKALLFMLFDLSACVQNDHNPTCPPGVQPCGDGLPACPGTDTCGADSCCHVGPH